jgi:hypothetical protein
LDASHDNANLELVGEALFGRMLAILERTIKSSRKGLWRTQNPTQTIFLCLPAVMHGCDNISEIRQFIDNIYGYPDPGKWIEGIIPKLYGEPSPRALSDILPGHNVEECLQALTYALFQEILPAASMLPTTATVLEGKEAGEGRREYLPLGVHRDERRIQLRLEYLDPCSDGELTRAGERCGDSNGGTLASAPELLRGSEAPGSLRALSVDDLLSAAEDLGEGDLLTIVLHQTHKAMLVNREMPSAADGSGAPASYLEAWPGTGDPAAGAALKALGANARVEVINVQRTLSGGFQIFPKIPHTLPASDLLAAARLIGGEHWEAVSTDGNYPDNAVIPIL